MSMSLNSALAAAAAVVALAGAVQAEPRPVSSFNARSAESLADRLVLCDVTAFLSGRPDLNANVIWVRRDDGHNDMLLPPDFVGAGRWYKEGYERLFWRLRRDHKVDASQIASAQNTLGRDFVEAYRHDNAGSGSRFLQAQDSYCRSMARDEGEIIS